MGLDDLQVRQLHYASAPLGLRSAAERRVPVQSTPVVGPSTKPFAILPASGIRINSHYTRRVRKGSQLCHPIFLLDCEKEVDNGHNPSATLLRQNIALLRQCGVHA